MCAVCGDVTQRRAYCSDRCKRTAKKRRQLARWREDQQDAQIVATAASGDAVLVVGHRLIEARAAFEALLDAARATGADVTSRANGAERINFPSGGSISFASIQSGSARGRSVDTLVIGPEMVVDRERMATLLPCLAASPRPEVMVSAGAVPLAALR